MTNKDKTLYSTKANIDLATTLTGGQAFRWIQTNTPNTFIGIVAGCKWQVSFQDGNLITKCLSPENSHISIKEFVHNYFDLNFNYEKALNVLKTDEKFSQTIDQINGIKILKQEWFEVIISFIISANNNIKRISRIIETMCKEYGTPRESVDGTFYSFPTPEQLAMAEISDLRNSCNTGYRDEYIKNTALKIADNKQNWQLADRWNFDELRTKLLELPGVGPKVADCILLYGFGRWETFPVDTWIRQIMTSLYFQNKAITDGNIRSFAQKQFGNLAGLAQQYLFEAARKGFYKK